MSLPRSLPQSVSDVRLVADRLQINVRRWALRASLAEIRKDQILHRVPGPIDFDLFSDVGNVVSFSSGAFGLVINEELDQSTHAASLPQQPGLHNSSRVSTNRPFPPRRHAIRPAPRSRSTASAGGPATEARRAARAARSVGSRAAGRCHRSRARNRSASRVGRHPLIRYPVLALRCPELLGCASTGHAMVTPSCGRVRPRADVRLVPLHVHLMAGPPLVARDAAFALPQAPARARHHRYPPRVRLHRTDDDLQSAEDRAGTPNPCYDSATPGSARLANRPVCARTNALISDRRSGC